ncbi:MAG TPA: VOC family protein [Acidimicrobiia bacterium]|nr:VOC family protein [Acidimicrobiia bacterium]
MSDEPVFDQVNLVVRDMDTALAFYRRLGLALPDDAGPEWPPGSGARHADVTMPNGARLEFDNPEMAAIWHSAPQSAGVVLGFSLASREAVDERYADLVAAGYEGRRPPYDAFWGARYAIVADADGNDVGLMSPIDPDRRYVPDAPT